MTTTKKSTNGTTPDVETIHSRVEELQLLLELITCGIKDDFFTGENRHRHVAALNRIAEKI